MKKILLAVSVFGFLGANAQTDLKTQFPELDNPIMVNQEKTYTPCGYIQEDNALENGRACDTQFPYVCADDFIIPASEVWDINTIKVRMFVPAGGPTLATGIDLYILDDGGGTPGTVLQTVNAAPGDWTTTYIGTNFGFEVHEFDISLPTPFTGLTGGGGGTTYWFAAQVVTSTGTFYWEFTTLTTYGSNGVSAASTAGPWTNNGDNFVFEFGKSTGSSQTLTECGPFSITVGTNTYNSTGVYADTLVSAFGCDSIVNTDLTVYTAPVLSVTQVGMSLSSDDVGATYQWLDCDNAMAPLAGETNQSYTAPAPGNFAVEVTTPDGCVDTSACYLLDDSGFDTERNLYVSVYPNPTNGLVILQGINEVPGFVKMEITSVTGELVAQYITKESELDLSTYAEGVYFLNVYHENGIETIRLIKE